MQILSLWTFGLVTLATIVLFAVGYPVARKMRTFWAWAKGTEPPKEKIVVFLPINIVFGLLIGGFAQSFYDAGSACKQEQLPLIPCTFQVLSHRS
jgi:hypothetical protein